MIEAALIVFGAMVTVIYFATWIAVKKGQASVEEPAVQVQLDITARSAEIVGYYMDKPIHKTVTLTDGKTYEFISVAVQLIGDMYYSEFIGEQHVRIDEHLLYKELKG